MFTMKDVCKMLDIPHETLRFYCNEGLIPNIKRDKNNYRLFDERNIAWIKTLQCLRKCGMSIKDMKQYMNYCLEGKKSVLLRKSMLYETKKDLERKLVEIHESLNYIDDKQQYFDDILDGKIAYTSNLIDIEETD